MTLNVCTYNVLAPCWASPKYYPDSSLPYLDKTKRRLSIINTLKSLALTHDFIALQETQIDEYPYFINALKPFGFAGFNVTHRDDYWKQYITSDPPFAPNGVALLWNTKRVNLLTVERHDLSDDGNRGIIGLFLKDNKTFRVSCIHLDSDTGGRRAKEAKALIEKLPQTNGLVDVILGDFNFNTDSGPYNNIFDGVFNNLLKDIGKEEMTHPFTFAYNGNDNYGIIDHILYRDCVPNNGQVLTFNVWTDGTDMEERINLLLMRNGSDHFVVTGMINY
ncbi:endonuclease/exonuclease/phosphatase [Fadolivirus algeromassiliense]|jgi:mRNA deadenylase 3'-5' endonuclease subunit Ccr4|uniref:Endonuclease/exonuclease/phosphatase n=1 Tax=Fadolivirus FV1/VV64 TaxID=3070911 RepID=A0A7D3V5R5_9VIRU|nr:endonuclease/exonuclease/phosphatase [Fadolivirus algeromassiliense]QKF94192.1 endonuclease/exonuclease/phosphatase [Fadolivirus FV1/VV64]